MNFVSYSFAIYLIFFKFQLFHIVSDNRWKQTVTHAPTSSYRRPPHPSRNIEDVKI